MDFESGVFPSIMDKAFATTLSLAPLRTTRKAAARTALVGLDPSSIALLVECFRQFNIDTVMEAARSSPSNSRCIIYGMGGNAQEAMRYSKYGINAIFNEPLERPAALKLVRATRMLVLHEFRRYVRIPVMTEVTVIGDGRRIVASSIEMSSGGMSVKSSEDFSIGTNVEVSFSLMTLPRVNVRGFVSWQKPKSFGVRFDVNDDRRQKVKIWIDSYLEN